VLGVAKSGKPRYQRWRVQGVVVSAGSRSPYKLVANGWLCGEVADWCMQGCMAGVSRAVSTQSPWFGRGEGDVFIYSIGVS